MFVIEQTRSCIWTTNIHQLYPSHFSIYSARDSRERAHFLSNYTGVAGGTIEIRKASPDTAHGKPFLLRQHFCYSIGGPCAQILEFGKIRRQRVAVHRSGQRPHGGQISICIVS
jgi:hypothetical protein